MIIYLGQELLANVTASISDGLVVLFVPTVLPSRQVTNARLVAGSTGLSDLFFGLRLSVKRYAWRLSLVNM